MIRNVCVAVVATAGVAVAEDLPWRFDGDVTREAASVAAKTADVSAPAVRVEKAGGALPQAFDSASGFSSKASEPLAVFDSNQRPGVAIIVR